MAKKTDAKTKEKKVTKEVKKISRKTLIIIVSIFVAIILLALYFYKWYDVKKEEKLRDSYLLTTDTVNLEIKSLDEVNQVLSEAPNDYFVLINYTGNEDTYKLEEGLKLIIDNYKLGDRFYYYNAKKLIDEDNYLAQLNKSFNTDKIKSVPIILYYQDGKLIDTVSRIDNNKINAGDFQKLLDIYEFEDQ